MSGAAQQAEPEFTERYRKNIADEEFLAKLNKILAPHEESAYEEREEKYPSINVIGAPRSGTTLLTQLICSCLDVGYINNLSAAFWRAPVHGIRLSNKLLRSHPELSYRSDFGRTAGLHEPHEFGYFWSRLLDNSEMYEKSEEDEALMDWSRIRLVLLNMLNAFGKPAAYKAIHLGWHIGRIQQELPRTCFVRIRRNPTDNALSILKMRRAYWGSVDNWVSFKPKEYDWLQSLPYWEQVVGQVYFLEQGVTERIESVGKRNVLEVRYRDVCTRPREVLEQVVALLEDNGARIPLLRSPPSSFTWRSFSEDDDDYRLVRAAVEKRYST